MGAGVMGAGVMGAGVMGAGVMGAGVMGAGVMGAGETGAGVPGVIGVSVGEVVGRSAAGQNPLGGSLKSVYKRKELAVRRVSQEMR